MNNEFDTTVVTEKSKEKKRKIHYKIQLNKVAFGLLLIAFAVFIILDSIGVSFGYLSDVPAFTLILGAFFIISILNDLVKLRVGGIFYSLAFIFMLFEKHIAKWLSLENANIINNWLLLLVATLLTIGCYLILPKRRKRSFIGAESNGRSGATFGTSTVYIDCTNFVSEFVENELGSCQVFFTNVNEYQGGGTLNVSNELGSMKIHVPASWKVNMSVKNELGAVNEPEQTKLEGEKTLRIIGTNELGAVYVVRE